MNISEIPLREKKWSGNLPGNNQPLLVTYILNQSHSKVISEFIYLTIMYLKYVLLENVKSTVNKH